MAEKPEVPPLPPSPTNFWDILKWIVICSFVILIIIIILANVLPPQKDGTTPSGTTPSGTTPSGTTPSGTTPSGTTPSGTTPSGTTPAQVKSLKKGFVYDLKINGSVNPLFNTQMNSLNLGWYYTWGSAGSPGLTLSLDFPPMIWGAPDATPANLAALPTGYSNLLAFNEPDGNQPGAQSNIPVPQVLQLWQNFMTLKSTNSNLRIGSVACSQNPLATSYTPNDGSPPISTSYFDNLWAALTVNWWTPDFICLHWYAPPDAAGFLAWIDNIWQKYNKPIWITEMCVADWSATSSTPEKYTTAEIQTFMDTVVAGMNSRSYVERYCWKTRPTTDVNMGNGALIALDGTLTPLGQHYATL